MKPCLDFQWCPIRLLVGIYAEVFGNQFRKLIFTLPEQLSNRLD